LLQRPSNNDNELSYLISPCLDFSGYATDPGLLFAHIFQTPIDPDEDAGWLEMTTDFGLNWNKVGTAADGENT